MILYGVIFMELFFGILFISFMFIGIVFSAYAVMYMLLGSKRKHGVVLLPLYENSGDIRRELSFLSFKYTFCDERITVAIVDMGLNNIQREVCEQFCREYPSVLLITPEQITEVL